MAGSPLLLWRRTRPSAWSESPQPDRASSPVTDNGRKEKARRPSLLLRGFAVQNRHGPWAPTAFRNQLRHRVEVEPPVAAQAGTRSRSRDCGRASFGRSGPFWPDSSELVENAQEYMEKWGENTQ